MQMVTRVLPGEQSNASKNSSCSYPIQVEQSGDVLQKLKKGEIELEGKGRDLGNAVKSLHDDSQHHLQ